MSHPLDALMTPRSVAVIGASDDGTRIGGRPLRYMLEAKFDGPLYPINPKRDEVQGLKAYPDISAVPGDVDLAVIAVPEKIVLPTLEACVAKGVRSAVLFSSGFAEVDAAGAEKQRQLTALSQASGMRIVGPNCLGMYNANLGVYATFSTIMEFGFPTSGPIGIASQSGAYGAHMAFLARRQGIQVGYWITTGNECDIDVADCIEWLAQSPEVNVIVAYAEGIRDGAALCNALAIARDHGKPVIFAKVGRSDVGALAAQSHTAALAGADAVYDAVFDRYGVYRAQDTEEMLDVAYAASIGSLPPNRRIGLISISGGVGIQLADKSFEYGLDVAPMPEDAQAKLKELVPFASPRNPVDITAQALNDRTLLRTNMELMVERGGYPTIVVYLSYVAALDFMVDALCDAISAARERAPDVVLVLSVSVPREIAVKYEELGCIVIEDPARAVRAAAALASFGEGLRRELPAPPAAAAAPKPLPAGELDEHRAKGVLADYGVPVAPERLAANAAEAVAAANELGLPVAMKLCSPDVIHKTEIGGVALGVATEAGVASAFEAIVSRAKAAVPDASIEGVLVASMLDTSSGVEVIIGTQRDPVFGPVVMVGLGGIFVEVMKDTALALAPVDHAGAMRMIESLAAYPLLTGARGRARCDVNALANAISRLSELALTHADSIQSIDVNPLLVLPEGQGAIALDALIVKTADA